jgi:hypothetical protein
MADNQPTDDDLLAGLRDALAPVLAMPFDDLVTQGQAIFTLRNLDEELAQLTYDSSAAPNADLVLTRTRDQATRTVVFESERAVVDLEITGTEAIGQITPPPTGAVVLETSTGTSTDVGCDELGCFSFVLPGAPRVRLRVHTASGVAVTEWLNTASS